MAAPHVSGSILLLKEAFPYLSGEDLLWAFYLSAVDLGIPGEDNIYGMGMIDVYAAFQYLSQNHIPIDPNSSNMIFILIQLQFPTTKKILVMILLFQQYILLIEGFSN